MTYKLRDLLQFVAGELNTKFVERFRFFYCISGSSRNLFVVRRKVITISAPSRLKVTFSLFFLRVHPGFLASRFYDFASHRPGGPNSRHGKIIGIVGYRNIPNAFEDPNFTKHIRKRAKRNISRRGRSSRTKLNIEESLVNTMASGWRDM